ncbi:hypothetical protein XA68_12232 [Ophiocordyceps unilateralis]|uniref:Uncharacterized protein n=1 Tax=Ophiocordyceps unilateralis TaxID=268505 RepID=A0A2A9PDQ5_OPHUN|nr:hypothetical protein XA68_12232 [Ophiocordyceps unilateralis]
MILLVSRGRPLYPPSPASLTRLTGSAASVPKHPSFPPPVFSHFPRQLRSHSSPSHHRSLSLWPLIRPCRPQYRCRRALRGPPWGPSRAGSLKPLRPLFFSRARPNRLPISDADHRLSHSLQVIHIRPRLLCSQTETTSTRSHRKWPLGWPDSAPKPQT